MSTALQTETQIGPGKNPRKIDQQNPVKSIQKALLRTKKDDAGPLQDLQASRDAEGDLPAPAFFWALEDHYNP